MIILSTLLDLLAKVANVSNALTKPTPLDQATSCTSFVDVVYYQIINKYHTALTLLINTAISISRLQINYESVTDTIRYPLANHTNLLHTAKLQYYNLEPPSYHIRYICRTILVIFWRFTSLLEKIYHFLPIYTLSHNTSIVQSTMSSPAMPYSTGTPMLSPLELQKFEGPLIALANLCGGDLRKLFYAFFHFLNRRTDFYCIMPDDNSGSRMGFKQGQAEQILLASFRQFPLRRVGPRPSATSTRSAPSNVKPKQSPPVKKDVPKKEVEKKKVEEESTSKPPVKDNSIKKDTKAEDESSAPSSKSKDSKQKSDTIRYTDEGKQTPVGNGGSTSRYVWTQTLEEVTVHIPLPEGIRAKDLIVKLDANSLSICQKEGKDDDTKPIMSAIEGMWYAKIRTSESTWTLESSSSNTSSSSEKITTLQLILDKVQKTWWACVLSGDTPHIDTTMVDSTRHISTYDEQTQAEIRRIMHDQRQERLGLPINDHPPMPPNSSDSEKVSDSLPNGVEYIDSETLDKASISKK